MQLLERQAPLASLAEYAAEARRGDGRLVFVAGEAGAGKSALVEQLQQDLPGARWSWGPAAKTVDHHVSAVLAKLGTPTRGAAAAEARRLGLAAAAGATAETG
jgi:chloramphenicol 3-O-phosphotransferase